MNELSMYWDRVMLGERFGVDHPFFRMVVDEVVRVVLDRNRGMVEVLMVGGGYEVEDVVQEVWIAVSRVWDRVDWSLGRRACFWFLVACARRWLQRLYRRYGRVPIWHSLDAVVDLMEGEELEESERELLASQLLAWDREVVALLEGVDG